ncbi:outer membrane beta-barrel protein [Lysobacter enzymogenes]|uniref:Outer membrane protein beta-barrel domain-containing protein n=1 Tax=Lysobacter enzymogenes TaxID=69 RepID=A0A3N2RAH4_LYSEN|nr:outer membrane beta-barrel protein [Lysobacter enzymogenes]ALH06680.1 Lax21C [Lysobacter enzymogenes]ROU04472.1 hypothetical protein D9T17_23955 [Lysobacter enzymogenes]
MKTAIARTLAAALAGALSLQAAAQERSYTYLEAGYVAQALEAPGDAQAALDDIDARGGYLAGSLALGQDWFVAAGVYKGRDDVALRAAGAELASFDLDAQQVVLGLGYRHALSERLDWTAELSWLDTRLAFEHKPLALREQSDGDDARLALGVRGDLAPNLEAWARLRYTDGDIYDGEFGGGVGVLLKFNRLWGVSAQAEGGAGNRQYGVGVRASF